MRSLRYLILLAPVVFLACGDDDGSTGGNLGDPCSAEQPCRSPLICGPEDLCVEPGSDAGLDAAAPDAQPGDAQAPDAAAPDAATDGGTECPNGEPPCDGTCCEVGQTCHAGACIADLGECTLDGECQDDSYCDDGQCVPYGTGPRGPFNPECTQLSIAGLFQPAIQCEFTAAPVDDPYPGHIRVLSTPTVVDFDLDDDPTTVHPSIVVMMYNGDDGSSGYYNGAYGIIRVLDGATCELQFNVGDQLDGCNSPALADLDGDGRAEIVVHSGYGQILAYRYDPVAGTFVQHCAGSYVGTAQVTGWAAPSIYDLDDDGSPEILSGGMVYDASCVLLDSSLGISGHMYSGAGYPVAADLDGVLDAEGHPSVEMATGSEIYRFDRVSRTWQEVISGLPYQGYIAVADFGTFGSDDPADDDRLTLDGVAEIVSVRAGNVYVMNLAGRLVYGPVPLPAGAGGGPPTVGDFDGDGLPEVAVAGSDAIAVFDMDCRGLPNLVQCGTLRTDGILWWQVSQDHSSNRTGASLFDFEGDGRIEVIYADEVFTSVYDGQTGEVLFSQWHSSCTWNENPIVADVDGDFNAELVVPSNQNCGVVPSTAGGVGYPASPNGSPMDPLFKGFRCESAADCVSGACDAGYCRCTLDDECGGLGSGFVCAVPPTGTPGTGNTCRSEWRGSYNGIRVYGDQLDRWVASRTIWSQHAYSVTHIEENGTVVPTSQWVQNWRAPGLNNFRQNVQGETNASSSPDMTGGQGLKAGCNSQGEAELELRVCNRGTQPVGAGVPVSFYEGPAGGTAICTVATGIILVPGQCETVTCLWTDPPGNAAPVDVTVVVDDDGTGAGQNSECAETNNTAVIREVYCQIIG